METIVEIMKVMEAFKGGEKIECKERDCVGGVWKDCHKPSWNWGIEDYRVKKNEIQYVDLGLPSGNLWATDNEEGYFTFDDAVRNFVYPTYDCNTTNFVHNHLPSKEDFDELLTYCFHRWNDEKKGIEILSPNGNRLFFPAMGRYDGSYLRHMNDYGYYMTFSPAGEEYGYNFYFNKSSIYMKEYSKFGYSVAIRLIKKK